MTLPNCPKCGCEVAIVDADGLLAVCDYMNQFVCCRSAVCMFGVDMKVTVAEHMKGEPGHAWTGPTREIGANVQ